MHGFTDGELADLARASVRASRASQGTRTQALADIDAWLAAPEPVAPDVARDGGRPA